MEAQTHGVYGALDMTSAIYWKSVWIRKLGSFW